MVESFRKPVFSLLTLFLLCVCLCRHPSFADARDDAADQTLLFQSFRKILPYDGSRDPLARFIRSVTEGPTARAELEQVLKDHHATSLKAFLHELDGILNASRTYLLDADRRYQAGLASNSERNAYLEDYSARRLTVDELAVVVKFYKDLDPRHTRFVVSPGLWRINAEVARLALSVTKFPYTEIREHEKDLPKLPYDDAVAKAWREAFVSFSSRGLRNEFDELWSQMVNLNSGHLRFRHISTFEERFILEVRRLAIVERDEFRGRNLLIAYLSNYASNEVLYRLGDDPNQWTPEDQKKYVNKLTGFVARFAHIKDRSQLRRFFENGYLPPSFSQTYDSQQVQRVLRVLKAASQAKGIHDCLSALQNAS